MPAWTLEEELEELDWWRDERRRLLDQPRWDDQARQVEVCDRTIAHMEAVLAGAREAA